MTSTHHTAKTAAVTAVAAWVRDAQPVTVTGDIAESYTRSLRSWARRAAHQCARPAQRRHQQRRITSHPRRTTTHHRRCAGPRW